MKLLNYLWTESSDQKQASGDRVRGHSPVSLTWCEHVSLRASDVVLRLGAQQGARHSRCPPLGSRHSRGVCVLSHFSRVWLSATLWLQPARLLCPWDFPARTLEWVTKPSSRGSSQPRDWAHVSYVSCIGRCHLGSSSSGERLAMNK